MIVIDCEVYANYFLLSALHVPTRRILHFEKFNDSALDVRKINNMLSKNTSVSFNGNNFDLPLITAALTNASNEKLKEICDKIIKSNLPAWKIAQSLNLSASKDWDHIDLIDVAPGQASLKIYGGRLHSKKLQDLPINPDAIITADQTQLLREYCENDLQTTLELYQLLEKQIDIRVRMSEQYGLDLRSKSDAQIAEAVLKSELTKATGKHYTMPTLNDNYYCKYQDPKIISFKTKQLQDIFEKILATNFELGSNGAVQLPPWLKTQKINIGGTNYQMGIGGLHSCEKSRALFCQDDEILIDLDVASYYPSIILQQRLAPNFMGHDFLKVYQSIVDRRLQAKKENDSVTANTLKIVVNGSFGKLGSKWSALYAPDLLVQTTITGQLALLMLIESLELAGVSVMSANTDGVVIHTLKDNENIIDEITFNWMMSTSYELERTDYRAVVSRDVNNYLAVKTDGSSKGKGVFAPGGLAKNPDCPIIYKAVAEHVAQGTRVADVIINCDDIRQFVVVRRVTGGAIWRGELLGKAVRFYYSNETDPNECIHYVKNSNKVPKSAGARPLMQLPDYLPIDIDYDFYVEMAEKLKCEIGL
ncbi:MAG: hypothetical protein IBX55_08955 [Methyloprofundus sp.]|nr:hypothetical protein [Methyloprofundus sp.]